MSDTIANFVDVVLDEQYTYSKRQLPMEIDEHLKVVLEFADICLNCELNKAHEKKMAHFFQRAQRLSDDELMNFLMVPSTDLLSLIQQIVPCVGCKKGAESLYAEVVRQSYMAFHPLSICKSGHLANRKTKTKDALLVLNIPYWLVNDTSWVERPKLCSAIDHLPRGRKRIRCAVHSLDSQKPKCGSTWHDLWNLMNNSVHDVVTTVDCGSFFDTVEAYLNKHRFCVECKNQVVLAYNILVGKADIIGCKTYNQTLFDGLRFCADLNHIHISYENLDFIQKLIFRAVPELLDIRRERHAKTLEVAQEEILTCLGIHIHDRLHRMWTLYRLETQIWQVLFGVCIEALRRNFEAALDRKEGLGNLEQLCAELQSMDRLKEQRREKKRLKKKLIKQQKKLNGAVSESAQSSQMVGEGSEKVAVSDSEDSLPSDMTLLSKDVPSQPAACGHEHSASGWCAAAAHDKLGGNLANYECDKDSGAGLSISGCESGRSATSSRNSFSEDCLPDIPPAHYLRLEERLQGAKTISQCNEQSVREAGRSTECGASTAHTPSVHLFQYDSNGPSSCFASQLHFPSLTSMLDDTADEAYEIPEEEIARFKATAERTDAQRQQLRATLRQKFEKMLSAREEQQP